MRETLAAAALIVVSQTASAQDCPAAELMAPARGQTVSAGRPSIEWRALPGVERYRVQMESRIPEGRVLNRVDTVVTGTKFASIPCAVAGIVGQRLRRAEASEQPSDSGSPHA